MWQINREEAKKAGYTDEEIDAYLNGLNQKSQEMMSSPEPTSNPLEPQKDPYNANKAPDVVDPFRDAMGTRITQEIGENEGFYGTGGHPGLDMVNENTAVTNPIGGLAISGYQPNGYGNYSVVVGGNPQELAQMDPAEKEAIIRQVQDYMPTAQNIGGLNIPGKNVTLQGHLAEPAPSGEIATGSANLTMGGSGGWAPHLHQEAMNPQGEITDFQKLIGGAYPTSDAYYGPNLDFNQIALEQIKKRTKK